MAEKTGRNDPCPCGSGKKYKRCCLGNEPPSPLPTRALPETPAPTPEPEVRAQTSSQPEFITPPESRDEWDDWFDRYYASDFARQLDMLRGLLAEDHPLEFYDDIEFVSTILQTPHTSSDEEAAYIAFLEEMLASRPKVFRLGADWFVRHMAYAYVRGGRERDIARLLPVLTDEDHEPESDVSPLSDLLGLADLGEEARCLAFAMLERIRRERHTNGAAHDVVEFALFFLHGDAIRAGCTPEARAELRGQLARIDREPSDEMLDAILAHRAGTAGRRFTLEELLGHGKPAEVNFYLLSLDFGRWLTEERRMPPLVADTMRCFVAWCVAGMHEESDRNPLVIHQQRLDRYLAYLLGLMSTLHLRGVATLIGMRHFQDFLRSVNLLDEGAHRRAKRICDDLWSQMLGALGDTAPNYAFLNKYL